MTDEFKSEELIDIVRDLQERIEALENRKPIPGPQGRPGNIDAALRNVEQALPKLVAAELERLKITTLRGEPGPRGEAGRNATAPTEELIESIVAKAMNESQLLDETGEQAGPLLKFAIEQELLKVQK